MNFGEQLKSLRKEKQLTQNELAKILNVKEYTIGDWERGRAEPDINTLRKIAIIFDISADELLEIETREERNKIISNNTITLKNSNNNNINL